MATVTKKTAIPTGIWKSDPVHSSVGFAVKHMVVATFRGRFEDFDATLEVGEDGSSKLVGTVNADSIVVKDENLAAHLKTPDFFDVENYPELRYEATNLRVAGDELVVDGELTIKGNTHPVTGRGSLVGPHEDIAGNTKIGINLETVIDRTQFGLEWNAPLPKGGFALANEVTLIVELELAKADGGQEA
jgi:polyisoprenoid-binding protein YceI